MLKIFEEDLFKRHDKNHVEKEITDTKTIRFEIDKNRYSLKITEKGIEVYKMGVPDDVIKITPWATNKIIIQ